MKLVFRLHALRRMAQRRISNEDVRRVIETGVVIEKRPEDAPFPSRLLLGWVRGRPLHVVAADDEVSEETIIITTYEPDEAKWTDDFQKRRQR